MNFRVADPAAVLTHEWRCRDRMPVYTSPSASCKLTGTTLAPQSWPEVQGHTLSADGIRPMEQRSDKHGCERSALRRRGPQLIPDTLPGVAYVAVDGMPDPVRSGSPGTPTSTLRSWFARGPRWCR
jgi:hypothetical protein